MKPSKLNPRRKPPRSDRRAGFSLIEALAALAIMGCVAATVVPSLGRLLHRWSAGEASTQRQDQWMQAMLRLSEDLGEALPLSLGEPGSLAFRADPRSVSFVRETLGPRGDVRLETVRWIIEANDEGDRLLRASGAFTPEGFASKSATATTEILAGAFRLVFGVVESNGRHSQGWPGGAELPLHVELRVAPAAGAARDLPAEPIALFLNARARPSSVAAAGLPAAEREAGPDSSSSRAPVN